MFRGCRDPAELDPLADLGGVRRLALGGCLLPFLSSRLPSLRSFFSLLSSSLSTYEGIIPTDRQAS